MNVYWNLEREKFDLKERWDKRQKDEFKKQKKMQINYSVELNL